MARAIPTCHTVFGNASGATYGAREQYLDPALPAWLSSVALSVPVPAPVPSGWSPQRPASN
jgi:hypothetical protein